MSDLKVGSFIYRRDGKPVEITGETKMSWIIGGPHEWHQQKIKKTAMRKGNSGEYWVQFFVKESDALDCVYAMKYARKISAQVEGSNGKILRQIADLIGFTAPDPESPSPS